MKFVALLIVALSAIMPLAAQTAALRGRVVDDTDAVVPGANVELAGPGGLVKSTTAANDGSYAFAGLDPGNYTVRASAPELALVQPVAIALKAGARTLNLQLKVAATKQQVTVLDNAAPSVTVDPSNNASALVLRGADLDALADDPDDLAADLQALAGPSAGPNGGSIFIDGFSGGQLPPKESIREIRINQNPFSPEYDKLGYGRIEIFTKPGTDKFRGTGFFNFGDDFWNTRNPYAQRKAPFLLKEYGGVLSGPISKRASFTLDIQRHSIDNGAIINGITLDPQTLAIVNPFTGVLRIPQRRIVLTPRVDYQLSANHTLTARYNFTRADVQDSGVGGFNLVSRGTHAQSTSHTAQVTETAVLGAKVVNETRFQFIGVGTSSIANSFDPAIQVLGSFNSGGAPSGHFFSSQNNYELQNYTSLIHGPHTLRFGVRLRAATVDDASPQNFGGTFTFGGGLAPELDANNRPVRDASGQPVTVSITSIEQYRRTSLFQQLGLPAAQIRALGGGATQFSVNAGNPALGASQVDFGAFMGDDWHLFSNLMLSLGMRYESQTNLHDRLDIAPRLGLAWAPGAKASKTRPKNVVRAGFGMFYDRFSLSNIMTARRYDGILQQQFVVQNPDFFPVVPSPASLAGYHSTETAQAISPALRTPYVVQSAGGFERQLPLNTTLAITYANTHGLHALRSQYLAGAGGPEFVMESSGLYNQNQLIVSVNSRASQNVSLFGSYVFNRAMSNTDGLGTFAANPYNPSGEYGPASTDLHHRVSLGGTINLKWMVRISPLLVAETGPPFDITVGRDLYGDTLFNGRPGIATDPHKPGLVSTMYGLLDPNPTAGEQLLPRNYGRGPGSFSLNVRIGKTFAFGSGEGHGGPAGLPGSGDRRRGDTSGVFSAGTTQTSAVSANRRYNLTIQMSIRNALNHTNPGAIIGNITSPLFGQANQPAGVSNLGGTGFSEAANNRRLELQTRFTF